MNPQPSQCRWCLAVAFYREFCILPDAAQPSGFARGYVNACRAHLTDLTKLASDRRRHDLARGAAKRAFLDARDKFLRERDSAHTMAVNR